MNEFCNVERPCPFDTLYGIMKCRRKPNHPGKHSWEITLETIVTSKVSDDYYSSETICKRCEQLLHKTGGTSGIITTGFHECPNNPDVTGNINYKESECIP